MRISSFRIKNYKSYEDSGEFKLSPGFNIIIGQNNVGKTALLEALSLKFSAKPHKSLISIPRPTSSINPMTSANVTLTVSGEELRDLLLNNQVDINLPEPDYEISETPLQFLYSILSRSEIDFSLSLNTDSSAIASANWKISKFPTHQLYSCVHGTGGRNYYSFRVNSDKSDFQDIGQTLGSENLDLGLHIANILRERIYAFRAERLNVSSCAFGSNSVLLPNASNLPEVLYVLQSNNPSRFKRFNHLVRQIFPSIYEISVKPKGNNSVEIVVWPEDPVTERADLAIELSESGTGIGQVLAILYVAISSNFSRTIIVDEPNSFLHPGAARKLIEILRGFPQHQYIVTTHSTEIIKAADPGNLTLIRWEKPKSILENLDAKKISEVQKCLIEVGAKLSDVYSADNILWVEGPTEEECFPKILHRIGKKSIVGTSILGVKNTGDFSGKQKKLILDIYKKLSTGNALLPKALAFVFDKENLTPTEIADIKRESQGLIHFLPRHTYENYLLHPAALAAIINSLTSFQEGTVEKVSEDLVLKWLKQNGGNKKYIDSFVESIDIEDDDWLKNVHGANLLKALFEEVSRNQESYQKTSHSIELTNWLIENDPRAFQELEEFLSAIVKEPV